jgi:hypothetical protein
MYPTRVISELHLRPVHVSTEGLDKPHLMYSLLSH